MKTFVLVDLPSGEILTTSMCSDEAEPPVVLEHQSVFELAAGDQVTEATHYFLDDSFCEYSEQERQAKDNRPRHHASWSNALMAWQDLRADSQRLTDAVDVAMQHRQQLLSQSDWTQVSDNRLTDKKRREWQDYRQALRDITDQDGYPLSVVWPEPLSP